MRLNIVPGIEQVIDADETGITCQICLLPPMLPTRTIHRDNTICRMIICNLCSVQWYMNAENCPRPCNKKRKISCVDPLLQEDAKLRKVTCGYCELSGHMHAIQKHLETCKSFLRQYIISGHGGVGDPMECRRAYSYRQNGCTHTTCRLTNDLQVFEDLHDDDDKQQIVRWINESLTYVLQSHCYQAPHTLKTIKDCRLVAEEFAKYMMNVQHMVNAVSYMSFVVNLIYNPGVQSTEYYTKLAHTLLYSNMLNRDNTDLLSVALSDIPHVVENVTTQIITKSAVLPGSAMSQLCKFVILTHFPYQGRGLFAVIGYETDICVHERYLPLLLERWYSLSEIHACREMQHMLATAIKLYGPIKAGTDLLWTQRFHLVLMWLFLYVSNVLPGSNIPALHIHNKNIGIVSYVLQFLHKNHIITDDCKIIGKCAAFVSQYSSPGLYPLSPLVAQRSQPRPRSIQVCMCNIQTRIQHLRNLHESWLISKVYHNPDEYSDSLFFSPWLSLASMMLLYSPCIGHESHKMDDATEATAFWCSTEGLEMALWSSVQQYALRSALPNLSVYDCICFYAKLRPHLQRTHSMDVCIAGEIYKSMITLYPADLVGAEQEKTLLQSHVLQDAFCAMWRRYGIPSIKNESAKWYSGHFQKHNIQTFMWALAQHQNTHRRVSLREFLQHSLRHEIYATIFDENFCWYSAILLCIFAVDGHVIDLPPGPPGQFADSILHICICDASLKHVTAFLQYIDKEMLHMQDWMHAWGVEDSGSLYAMIARLMSPLILRYPKIRSTRKQINDFESVISSISHWFVGQSDGVWSILEIAHAANSKLDVFINALAKHLDVTDWWHTFWVPAGPEVTQLTQVRRSLIVDMVSHTHTDSQTVSAFCLIGSLMNDIRKDGDEEEIFKYKAAVRPLLAVIAPDQLTCLVDGLINRCFSRLLDYFLVHMDTQVYMQVVFEENFAALYCILASCEKRIPKSVKRLLRSLQHRDIEGMGLEYLISSIVECAARFGDTECLYLSKQFDLSAVMFNSDMFNKRSLAASTDLLIRHALNIPDKEDRGRQLCTILRGLPEETIHAISNHDKNKIIYQAVSSLKCGHDILDTINGAQHNMVNE